MQDDRGKEKECIHCGAPAIFSRQGNDFCCNGCERVYTILHKLSLEAFYNLRSSEDLERALPPREKKQSFDYLDDEAFRKEYLKVLDEQRSLAMFSLEGVHCTACIWLLEQLPRICDGVQRSELIFDESKLTLIVDPSVKLSSIAESIEGLGYTPMPRKEGEGEGLFERESLGLLLRFGVAAVSAGNCMMIAISLYEGEYTGIEQRYELFFLWVSALVATPAILYSAQPFYRAAYAGLKHGALHVDLPISIGIVFGYLLSVISVFFGWTAVYFDSLTILIFLMLGGRVLQRYTLRKTLHKRDSLEGLLPLRVTRIAQGEEAEIYRGSLKVGDIVSIAQGGNLPADGMMLSDSSELDLSILTGESEPLPILKGEKVYAGSTNLGAAFLFQVEALGGETRLGVSLKQPSEAKRGSSVIYGMLEHISRYFVFAVLSLAMLCFLYWYVTVDLGAALQVTLAFIVVTCPCALGLSAPLILARGVSDAAREGIIVSDPSAFERFTRSKHYCFDKTGTLTERNSKEIQLFQYHHSEWQPLDLLPERSRELLALLESESVHPIGRALKRLAGSMPRELIFTEKNVCRTGVSAKIDSSEAIGVGSWTFLQDHYSAFEHISSELPRDGSVVYYFVGEDLYAFLFSEKIEEGALPLFQELKSDGATYSILSGDTPSAVRAIGDHLQLSVESLRGDCSPEDKVSLVEEINKETVMIGDGANDSASMLAADLAIGMSGGAEQVLRVAQVFVAKGGMKNLYRFYLASKKIVKTLRWSFLFALTYNLLAGSAALCGYISPLFAAILMPISSLTVIAIAIFSKPFSRSALTGTLTR